MADGKGPGGGGGGAKGRPKGGLGGVLSGGPMRLLVGLAGAGVLLIVISGMFGTASGPGATAAKTPKSPAGAHGAASAGASANAAALSQGAGPNDPVLRYEHMLDQNVAVALGEVGGAGQVTVAITVAASPSHVLAENTSSTRESQGGATGTVQSSQQDALAYQNGKTPVMTSESAPPVVGALVVASGASDPVVRAELTQAVETLLGLGANQVMVLPGKEGM